jgi:hypothetical protein
VPTNYRFKVRSRVAPAGDLDEMARFMLMWMKEWFLEREFGPDWEDIAAAAWQFHGRRLTAEWIGRRPGTRPPAWWEFEAPAPRLAGESEYVYLLRHGLLTRWEARSNGG